MNTKAALTYKKDNYNLKSIGLALHELIKTDCCIDFFRKNGLRIVSPNVKEMIEFLNHISSMKEDERGFGTVCGMRVDEIRLQMTSLLYFEEITSSMKIHYCISLFSVNKTWAEHNRQRMMEREEENKKRIEA